uniref:Uncharacterized protein n=1 Tax=Pseudo-nitzschia delicatissima TaxID=44447 RepID=A0A7S0XL84_9STRA|mmetsp:Transcript_1748/g.4088  ORF Transcript_1748/g.4088 Transcript_1748/m.4088 type:complete len:374 (+) Transcript_1748:335-1456(+)|eukprot:CAMPEP_0116101322 /NCGR_PEP_ID=MMETSP0327-20121206/12750_1 /TAXON_ID=44447 /ORGANISM="Pseudo-nitzschia delicatissima, Strain B596" /LENGTH=373 /DNA_ID=CAMNT_0003593279 /DNA_START=242 /DNA_END=1363 /DNA_ORIENTATION=-
MGFLIRNKLNFRNNKKKEVTQPITGAPDNSARISTRKKPKSSKRRASTKASRSNAKSSCRRIPLNCLNQDDDASASQVDMVDLSVRTSPMHSTKNPATKNPDSMMTPDMLEVLGLTELHKSYQFYPEKPKKKETASIPASHSLHPKNAVVLHPHRKRNTEAAARARQTRDTETSRKGQTTRQSETTKQTPQEVPMSREKQTPREKQTAREVQPSKSKKAGRDSETSSRLYYADNDAKSLTSACTFSTCSSDGEYYEPMSSDPCDCDVYYPCQEDDWTFSEGTNCYDRGTNTSKKDYQESALSSFDPVSCVGMVLTMPIACGLLCIDNVLDTNYFESASESLKTASTSDKPEFLVIEEKKRSHRNKRSNTALMA